MRSRKECVRLTCAPECSFIGIIVFRFMLGVLQKLRVCVWSGASGEAFS